MKVLRARARPHFCLFTFAFCLPLRGASAKKSRASKCVAGACALAEAARLSLQARRALAVGFTESVYFAFRAGGGRRPPKHRGAWFQACKGSRGFEKMSTAFETLTEAPALEDYFGLSEAELYERIEAARRELGSRLVILGHHYQRDDVVCHADYTGDSFKLSKLAASRPEAEFVVFCGVHFMAESADILKPGEQKVILPDLGAGCSMADMATAEQPAPKSDRKSTRLNS